MMVLVLGGSGSGKSSYAETTAVALAQEGAGSAMKKYYLATMQVFDGEGKRKVEKHRRLRAGKGFLTIEQPAAISGALEKMAEGERTVLLECLSNLTANEMFPGGAVRTEQQVTERITGEIGLLREQTTHLVVVSDNVFEDGVVYDETTMAYIRAMGKINQRLAALAENVVEVVAGIPLMLKES
ncbi:MAG: bifunctional adenosylcobinamide kinase/adenosylcobinamide-phosphate guanylyltransferase [Muribaculaceae bacterium]|nr:bifunctional adenosylcobinamide kinase/adenosylcobinamide-phosphate guanylyltransferase [Roseburia sp.]MCM1431965.1 bifunctional adenosylcobinamide kinase/adenosylcobinamide-phosphate guanylyltransferase [Muribaculaceae bacterium]MCM1493595.1 bifunctional adenosylcobinamide kinase/adenosylcobinamide-phosphate guanylyltransferase [Muribaculaceae bacterium]